MIFDELIQKLYEFIYMDEEDKFEYISLEQLVLAEKFCDIILKNSDFRYYKQEPRFKENFSIDKSIKYSKQFLESLKSEYSSKLSENIDKSILKFCSDDLSAQANVSFNNGEKNIYVPIRNNITDSQVITHEQIHDTNLVSEDVTPVWSYFSELPSLLAELLQIDFFKQNNFDLDELKKYKKVLMKFISYRALNVKVELGLLKGILINGYIDKSYVGDLFYELYEVCKDEEQIFVSVANSIDKLLYESVGEVFYFFDLRYVIGSVLASYLHDKILSNPDLKKDFADYNEIFSYYDFNNIFESMGLEFNPDREFDLTEESYKVLEKCFKKEVNRL